MALTLSLIDPHFDMYICFIDYNLYSPILTYVYIGSDMGWHLV